MSNKWFETVAEAQRRAKRRLPRSVYGALVAGSERGLTIDDNMAAFGEWRFGSGRGCAHFVYVTISTGIGGGIIVDNALLLGRNGMAGEVGHMTVWPDGPICCCGNHGCWEALASGTALAQFAAEALAGGQPSLIRDIAAGSPVRGAHVAAAAGQGDLRIRSLTYDVKWIGERITRL